MIAYDHYVAYDNSEVGKLVQALLDGMAAVKPAGPYNIELFSGFPDGANSKVFFNGATEILLAAVIALDPGPPPSGRPITPRSARVRGSPKRSVRGFRRASDPRA